MKPWKKITLGIVGGLVVLGIVLAAIAYSRRNVVTVQTAKSQVQDLASVVSASGEIKPKTYVNVGANAFGKITHLYVKEGERVHKGQLLAQIENVQPSPTSPPRKLAWKLPARTPSRRKPDLRQRRRT